METLKALWDDLKAKNLASTRAAKAAARAGGNPFGTPELKAAKAAYRKFWDAFEATPKEERGAFSEVTSIPQFR